MFVLAYAHGDDVTNQNSYRKYFLPRFKIKNYNIEVDGRNFYDQSINDLIKQYDEVRKISTGQSDDYTTGCLLDFAYFEKNYKLIAADLSKQKEKNSKSKLNSFETLISQALAVMDISHEGFVTVLKEKDKYEKMNENLRSGNEEYKIMILSSIKFQK